MSSPWAWVMRPIFLVQFATLIVVPGHFVSSLTTSGDEPEPGPLAALCTSADPAATRPVSGPAWASQTVRRSTVGHARRLA